MMMGVGGGRCVTLEPQAILVPAAAVPPRAALDQIMSSVKVGSDV
jgi:hypothetical protein